MSEEVVLNLDVQREIPVDYSSPNRKYLLDAMEAESKAIDRMYKSIFRKGIFDVKSNSVEQD